MSHNTMTRAVLPIVLVAALVAMGSAAEPTDPLLAIENPEAPTLGGDDLFGTAVAVAGGKIVVGAPRDDPNGVSNAGSAYLIDIATGAVTPLRKPTPAANDQFGAAVAATERPVGDPRGPGFDFLVGAPFDDTAGATNAGAAYLFDGTTGALRLTLRTAPVRANDRFGSAVAGVVFGVLVIGAPLADVGAVTDAGIVYVYDASRRDSDGLGAVLPILTIENPEPTQGDQFGAAVAASGADLVVGVPLDDPGSVSNSGSVYRFPGTRRNADGRGAVLPNAIIRKAVPILDDEFGSSVAASGGAIFIGVPREEEESTLDAGAVYAWLDGAGLHRFPNPDPDTNDRFGDAVAASGDHIVVGTPADDSPGAGNAGSVYVLSVTGQLVRTLPNPDAAENDDFGRSVAAAAGTFVAGAPRDDLPGAGKRNAGSGYVFGVAGAVVKVLNPEEPTLLSGDDQFGMSVAALARGPSEPRGPGLDAIVGAPNDDPLGIPDAGSVYLFDGDTGDLLLTIPNPEPTEGDFFGFSVIGINRPAGDFRGPGQDILVGSMLDSPAGVFQAGSAFLFDSTRRDGDGLGPVLPILTIRNPDTDPPPTFDHFGAVVGALGDRIIVTSMFDDAAGALNTGALYVFAGIAGGPGGEPPGSLLLAVRNPDPNQGDWFAGWSVMAVDRAPNDPRGPGKDILTGASFDDSDPDGRGPAARVADAGTAYLIDGDTGAILLTIQNPDLALVDPDGAGPLPHPGRSDRFGFSVAADGTRLIIGAMQDRVGNADSAGTVYVFDGTRRDGDGLGPGTPLLTIRNPYPGNNDVFGWAVDVLRGDIIVGAMQDSDPDGATGPEPAAFQQGSVFLFDGSTGELLRIIADPDPDDVGTPPREFDHFGNAVAAFGNRILTGAMFDDTETIRNAGAAYIHARENVQVDIKPGNFPNSINLHSQGTVAFAIVGGPSIDAATIDPLSVTLAGAPITLRGNGVPQATLEDLNGDGYLDLVGHVLTQALELSATDSYADVRGRLFNGTPILGRDSVRVVR